MDACTELKPDCPDGFLASLTQRQRVTRNSPWLLPGKAGAGQFRVLFIQPCSTISSELSGAIRKSVRHPTLPWFTVPAWARAAATLECSAMHLNSPRATYSAARRGLGTQRWRPGSSHSSTCHRCSPSVHSTGTTCGCHPPGRCWSGTAGPRGAGTASSPSGTARAHTALAGKAGKGILQG